MALVFLESATDQPSFLEKFSGKQTGQTTIGVGKPLCIEILHFYSGDAPQKMFGGDKSALIISGFKKGLFAFDASPRFLNFWKEKVGDRQIVDNSVFDESTKLVYYSPAMDEDTIDIELEVRFKKMDKNGFEQMSGMLNSASKLPLFIGSEVLVAGAGILKMAGKLFDALKEKDNDAFLSDKLELDFVTKDKTLNINQFPVCCRDQDEELFRDYQVVLEKNVKGIDEARLVHKDTGDVYKGDKPYLLLSISGEERIANGEFTPRVVSAAMLEQFYSDKNKESVIQVLFQSTKLFNDMNFAGKIRDAKKQLKGLKAGDPDFAKLGEQIKAYEKNILSGDYKEFLKIK